MPPIDAADALLDERYELTRFTPVREVAKA
jgi:hypothetical protein